jgi:hypothetical protein
VEELAEVLALDFDDADGIPKLKASWRWEDQEQALLSSCSSLITIVYSVASRVVQFSHFSVKEFLTSPRLATPSRDVSCYHIALEPAHTILGQACMGILLRLDEPAEDGSAKNSSPLAQYAAEHWVSHAQFKGVSTRLRKEMDCLFDPDKPHFVLWLRLYDIDTKLTPYTTLHFFTPFSKSDATPLYYAALCGFDDLAKSLVVKYPNHVNAYGGWYMRPLVAALAREHFQTAQLLQDIGADPNVEGYLNMTPLHEAAFRGYTDVVKKLLEYGADAEAQDADGKTPLYLSSGRSYHRSVRLLLEHGVDVNAQAKDGSTPLHQTARYGHLDSARLLLEHGADLGARDDEGKTPLQLASERPDHDIYNLLLEYSQFQVARPVAFPVVHVQLLY